MATETQETIITESEQINLAVAAIAGWTDVEIWQPERNLAIRTYQGVNLAHPELGRFVPNYVEDLNAITKVFSHLGLGWISSSLGYASSGTFEAYETTSANPALALCKLLLQINPEPIKPTPKQEIAVIDEDGEIESRIIEF